MIWALLVARWVRGIGPRPAPADNDSSLNFGGLDLLGALVAFALFFLVLLALAVGLVIWAVVALVRPRRREPRIEGSIW